MVIEMHLIVGITLALCGSNGFDERANTTHVELFPRDTVLVRARVTAARETSKDYITSFVVEHVYYGPKAIDGMMFANSAPKGAIRSIPRKLGEKRSR